MEGQARFSELLLDFMGFFMKYSAHAKEPAGIPRRSLENVCALALRPIDKGMHPEDAARFFEVGRAAIFG
jgi:hypothetical protein